MTNSPLGPLFFKLCASFISVAFLAAFFFDPCLLPVTLLGLFIILTSYNALDTAVYNQKHKGRRKWK